MNVRAFLTDNPIYLTQRRLVHRGGVLASTLIAAIVGLTLLSGLIAYLAAPFTFRNFVSAQDAGRMFYAWTIAVEILVLVIGGFSRISRTLAEERKAGLWDSNRLTPLQPSDLLTGYLFGSSLRELYMALVLAGTGLTIVVLAGLSPVLWLGTQVLIFSTALLLGLIALIVGMTLQRPQTGIIFLVAFIFFQLPFMSAPRFVVVNFIFPLYGIAHLFTRPGNPVPDYSVREYGGMPHIFSLAVDSILLTLGLQAVLGIFLWRAAIRKTRNPFQPLMPRWEAVAIFGFILLVQHGLVWSIWHGQFPVRVVPDKNSVSDFEPLLSVVHCGTILLAAVILAAASPQPEAIRQKALRLGFKSVRDFFPSSAVSLALVIAAVSALALLSQCALAIDISWKFYLVAVGNLLSSFLIFALLLEYCRLRHKRRAFGFLALWLFVLCILPFILAGVFSGFGCGNFSLLSPGAVVLTGNNDDELNVLIGVVAFHFAIAFFLFLNWQRQWNTLLQKATSTEKPTPIPI